MIVLPHWLEDYRDAERIELEQIVTQLNERETECSWHKADCIAVAVIKTEAAGDQTEVVYQNWPRVSASWAKQLAKLGRTYEPTQRYPDKPITWYKALTELAQEQNDLKYPRSGSSWDRLRECCTLLLENCADWTRDQILMELGRARKLIVPQLPGVNIDVEAGTFLVTVEATPDGESTIIDGDGEHHGNFSLKQILRRFNVAGRFTIYGSTALHDESTDAGTFAHAILHNPGGAATDDTAVH